MMSPALAVPILPFTDVDSVIAQVNREWARLGCSVWSAALQRAAAVAGRLHAGSTWINNARAMGNRAPFGGFRQSGIGRELGREGLQEFTEPHTVSFPA
jgi:acyl-CoA reductase-like NAD-dependent aldehyde dehydrogenase